MASIETWMNRELEILKNTITDEKEMELFNHTEPCIREEYRIKMDLVDGE